MQGVVANERMGVKTEAAFRDDAGRERTLQPRFGSASGPQQLRDPETRPEAVLRVPPAPEGRPPQGRASHPAVPVNSSCRRTDSQSAPV